MIKDPFSLIPYFQTVALHLQAEATISSRYTSVFSQNPLLVHFVKINRELFSCQPNKQSTKAQYWSSSKPPQHLKPKTCTQFVFGWPPLFKPTSLKEKDVRKLGSREERQIGLTIMLKAQGYSAFRFTSENLWGPDSHEWLLPSAISNCEWGWEEALTQ